MEVKKKELLLKTFERFVCTAVAMMPFIAKVFDFTDKKFVLAILEGLFCSSGCQSQRWQFLLVRALKTL